MRCEGSWPPNLTPWAFARALPSLVRARIAADNARLIGGAFFWSFSPPTLSERSHCGLAALGIAVCRTSIFVVPENQGPHPRRYCGRGIGLEDTTDHGAILEHVEVVIAPLPVTPCANRIASVAPSRLPASNSNARRRVQQMQPWRFQNVARVRNRLCGRPWPD